MKKWYKNSLIVGLILLAAGWFIWMTRTGMVVQSKADDSEVKVLKKEVEAAREISKTQLEGICQDINELKGTMKTHEEKQEKQVGKIYDLLISMSRESKIKGRESR